MPQSSSSCKFMCVCTFLSSSYHFIWNGQFWHPPPQPLCDPLLTPGASKMTFAWEIALGIKQLWKIVLTAEKLTSPNYPKDSGFRPVYFEFAKLRAFRAHLPTCLCFFRAHLPTCPLTYVPSFRYFVLTCGYFSRDYVRKTTHFYTL